MLKAALVLSWVVTFIVCIWSSAVVVSVTSQAPDRYNPTTQASDTESDASVVARGTRSAPIFVRVMETESPNNSAGYPQHDTDGNFSEKITAAVAGVALIVAIWQLVYFGRQLRIMNRALADSTKAAEVAERTAHATERSVIAMRESDERQLRPYVEINLRLSEFLDKTEPFMAQIECDNHGKTPALRVSYRANFQVLPTPLPDQPILKPIDGRWNEDRMDLYPSRNGRNGALNCNFRENLSKETCAGIIRGQLAIIVGMEIKYLDAFGSGEDYITRKYICVSGSGHFTIPGGSFAC